MTGQAKIYAILILFTLVQRKQLNTVEKQFQWTLWTCKSRKGLGTRSHHCYKPISTISLEIRVSSDDIFTVVQFKKIAEVSSNDQFTTGKYIACAYDDRCYIALIHEYSNENRDVRV